MALIPLNNTFLFEFLNTTKNGVFEQKNKGRIFIPNAAPELDSQGSFARWVRVLAVGPDVTDFGIDDIVLLSAGKWTIGFRHADKHIWKSDDEWVLGINDARDESVAFDYVTSY